MTSSPVSSTWMPPGWLPSARCTSKNPRTSSTTRSKCLVLNPLALSSVLPCIGSHCQTTGCPVACTFSMTGGSRSCTLRLPIREISVSRPGVASGSSRSTSSATSAGLALGPTFMPIGFAIRATKSMCAPPRARVRSPTQTKCPDRSYAPWPPTPGRVSARSYSRISASCEQ